MGPPPWEMAADMAHGMQPAALDALQAALRDATPGDVAMVAASMQQQQLHQQQVDAGMHSDDHPWCRMPYPVAAGSSYASASALPGLAGKPLFVCTPVTARDAPRVLVKFVPRPYPVEVRPSGLCWQAWASQPRVGRACDSGRPAAMESEEQQQLTPAFLCAQSLMRSLQVHRTLAEHNLTPGTCIGLLCHVAQHVLLCVSACCGCALVWLWAPYTAKLGARLVDVMHHAVLTMPLCPPFTALPP